MKPVPLLRLALAGSRTDTLRVTLTAASAALAMLAVLAAATVIAIPEVAGGYNNQYTTNYLDESGLRPGVTTALILLIIPTLVLAAQCGRLGAPARDRRLAAIRLAGAAPRQAVSLVAVETGIAATLGAIGGLAIYLVGRKLLHNPGPDGLLPLPTDVLPSPLALIALTLALPLLATAVAALALRRVTVGPFGVVRRVRVGAPRIWPGLLVIPGIGAVAVLQPLTEYARRQDVTLPAGALLAVVAIGALLTVVGVVFGTGWLSHTVGRTMARFARRPAPLLAGRRLIADPWSGSRAFAVLLACVVFGAGAAGLRAQFTTDFAVNDRVNQSQAEAHGEAFTPRDDLDFYFSGFDLVNAAIVVAAVIAAGGLLVTVAEGIVSRRHTYAHLTAAGVPRSVLGRAMMWQAVAPVIPATIIAAAAGVSMTRALFGNQVTGGGFEGVPEFTMSVPFPVGHLGLLSAATVLVVVAALSVSLIFLRPSTHPAELRVA